MRRNQLCALLASVLAAGAALAQPLPPNPAAPVIDMPGPMGAQRGTAVELLLTGERLAHPTGLWTSFPSKVTIPTDHGNGQDGKKLRVRIELPPDAPLGFHGIRLATRQGLSNLRLFCIDDLPQVVSAGRNPTRANPMEISAPCVVAGRVTPEGADYYRILVRGEDRLTFEVLGRRLGSPLDPEIALYDARGRRELAGGYSNDEPGLQSDPRLTYRFHRGGAYLVVVRDTRWAGGPDYWYRLRVGDFPCATSPLPMSATRGSRLPVTFAGPLVDQAIPVHVEVPKSEEVPALWVTPRSAKNLAGWPVALAASPIAEVTEHEPNDNPAQANRIAVPSGLTGRFEHPGDIDYFVFRAEAGQHYVAEAQSPFAWACDVRLTLLDTRGAEVAQSDPQQPRPADQRVEFQALATQDYCLQVEHLSGGGGPAEVYHLVFRRDEPDFSLEMASDRCDVPVGGYTLLEVRATRHGYAGAIHLSVLGPGGLEGAGVIAARETTGYVFLHAAGALAPGPRAITISGQGSLAGRPISHVATVRGSLKHELANLAYPPPNLTTTVGVAVTPPAPIALKIGIVEPEVLRSSHATLRIEVDSTTEKTGPLLLRGIGLPSGIALPGCKLAPGQQRLRAELVLQSRAPLGDFPISLAAEALGAPAVIARPAILHIVRPFDLSVETPSLFLAAGSAARLRVHARRHAGYAGPIQLTVRGLPPGVSALPALIPPGQSAGDIVLQALPGIHALQTRSARIVGTVQAPPGQGNVSPPFTLAVGPEKSAGKPE